MRLTVSGAENEASFAFVAPLTAGDEAAPPDGRAGLAFGLLAEFLTTPLSSATGSGAFFFLF